jgi:hypothetical protein
MMRQLNSTPIALSNFPFVNAHITLHPHPLTPPLTLLPRHSVYVPIVGGGGEYPSIHPLLTSSKRTCMEIEQTSRTHPHPSTSTITYTWSGCTMAFFVSSARANPVPLVVINTPLTSTLSHPRPPLPSRHLRSPYNLETPDSGDIAVSLGRSNRCTFKIPSKLGYVSNKHCMSGVPHVHISQTIVGLLASQFHVSSPQYLLPICESTLTPTILGLHSGSNKPAGKMETRCD